MPTHDRGARFARAVARRTRARARRQVCGRFADPRSSKIRSGSSLRRALPRSVLQRSFVASRRPDSMGVSPSCDGASHRQGFDFEADSGWQRILSRSGLTVIDAYSRL